MFIFNVFIQYGGGPVLTKNDSCLDCLKDAARILVFGDSYRNRRTSMKEIAEAVLSGICSDGTHYVSRPWYSHEAFPDSLSIMFNLLLIANLLVFSLLDKVNSWFETCQTSSSILTCLLLFRKHFYNLLVYYSTVRSLPSLLLNSLQ